MDQPVTPRLFPVRDYDLAATLASGQAFRWRRRNGSWEGVIDSRWVRLTDRTGCIEAQTAVTTPDWEWLVRYLQLEVDLTPIVAAFPQDAPMQQAVAACRGLRLLRQDPWECLASFILSSSKQIVQIQQIVALLCSRFGDLVPAPAESGPQFAFPTPERLAETSEDELRACKMGFRAPYLKATAGLVAERKPDLTALSQWDVGHARAELLNLPGVGRKIADCVLLFAFGFSGAFPVDVWVMKALRELYFRRRRVKLKRLQQFSSSYFGPYGGYAQQYLFHYMRNRSDTQLKTGPRSL